MSFSRWLRRQPNPLRGSRSSGIAEILESLFLKDPELVADLLGELERADTATLANYPARRSAAC
jgi:hypothetical protein